MRPRARRGGGAVVSVALAAAVALAACSSGDGGAGRPGGTAASAATSLGANAPAGSAAGQSPAAEAWWRSRPACAVSLPPTLTGTVWRPGNGHTIWPEGGVSSDGWLAVTEYGDDAAGVALWNVATNERREVYRFATPQGSAMGVFDGRYLVSKEVQSSTNWNVFTLRAYDLVTGQTWTLDTNPPPDQTGQVPATPLESFGLHDGTAWWVRATAANVTAVKVADLASRKATTLATGDYVTAQFFGDGLLVEHFSEAKYGVRDWLSLAGKAKPLPARIAKLNGNRWVAVGPRGDLAYLNDDWTELYYAGPADDAGRLILQTTIKTKFQNLPVLTQAGLLVPTMEPATYYLDTAAGTYARVLDGNFGTVLGDRVLTLTPEQAAKPKTTAGYDAFRVLTLPAGALGTCPTTPPPLTPSPSSAPGSAGPPAN